MEGLINIKKYFDYIKRKFILNNYYTSTLKKGKNLQAALLDFAFTVVTVIAISGIMIYWITEEIFLALATAVVLGMAYIFLMVLWNRRIRRNKILRINENIADSEIIREITRKDNREFQLYIKDILEKFYKTTFYEYNRYIDFVGEINGEMYGLKCLKSSMDAKVSYKELEFFMKEMNEKNIKEGIIVTNSYFSDDLKEKTEYLLIDFNQIKAMLKEIGSYPTQKDVEDLIIAKYDNRKSMLKEKFTSKGRDKVLKFTMLGIVLIIYSRFVSYEMYYRLIGFASVGIGLILAIYNIAKYIEGRRKEV
ncbi:MAG TPA: hypothetical protein GXX53_00905 [Tissierellia bacterium]|nr:hypothetical protein [Tissierellia bacterium]